MGKSSGLAILALLVGIGGLGLGAYSYFIFSGQIEDLTDQFAERAVIDMWYAEYLEDWTPSVVDSNESVITVNFQVNAGEKVYFLFITRAIIYSNIVETYMRFTFNIDGVILNKPYTIAGGRNIDETWVYIPVALQYSIASLTAGNHSVSAMVLKEYASNFIRQSTFLVQTYI